MKKLTLLFLFVFGAVLFAQNEQQFTLADYMIQAEENPSTLLEAEKKAVQMQLPVNAFTSDERFYYVIGMAEGMPLYAKITDPAHPSGGELISWQQMLNEVDVNDARVNYGNGRIEDNRSNVPESPQLDTRAATRLMVVESTTDAVMSFDPNNGDLLDMTFIDPDPTNLSTPNHAILVPWGKVLVSEQLDDHVVQYDTTGTLDKILCQSGADTLDNLRGIRLHPNTGNILITVASGGMDDAVVEYTPAGDYVRQFIVPDDTKTNSPWCILFRDADVLVTASMSDNVYRYDYSGTPLSELIGVADLSFPMQMIRHTNGDLLIAEFSSSPHGSGVAFFDSSGNWQKTLAGVTGNRGVYVLGNGNILTTNGSGVHEIDPTSGALIRTVVSGVSGRYIEEYDVSVIPVELTGFRANVVDGNVVLNWATATETNNSGFQVQRSIDNELFTVVDFVEGHGTSTEKQSYTYTDKGVTAGTYYYRLKQIDFDGSFAYSPIISVEVDAPSDYALNQNYPNPFNPSTMISFALPVEAHVTVTVYNSLGETVTTLISETLESGHHDVQFNALDLSSGLYFYNVNAEGIDGSRYNETMKMMLMK